MYIYCTSTSGCDGGQEELSHVQGQEQKPGGPHALGAVAERSYPTSEFGGGGAAERSYPASEVRNGGWEELPNARGQGQRPGKRSNPTFKQQSLGWCRRA